jgi:threonine/homoserine/homoserine lactone efflux protein
MYMDYFAVPNLTLPVRRGQRPPILRFVAFVVVVLTCVAVDALVLFALYKAGAALITQFDPVLLAQGALGSAAVLYLAYRVRRALRGRTADENDQRESNRESVGS